MPNQRDESLKNASGSEGKPDQCRVRGAGVPLVDNSSLPPEHPDGCNRSTPRLARETPDCGCPYPHRNRDNHAIRSHGFLVL